MVWFYPNNIFLKWFFVWFSSLKYFQHIQVIWILWLRISLVQPVIKIIFKHSRSMIRNRKTIRIKYILPTNVGVPYKTFYKAFAYQGKVHQNVSGSRWSGHHNITWNNYRIICLMYANVTRRVLVQICIFASVYTILY